MRNGGDKELRVEEKKSLEEDKRDEPLRETLGIEFAGNGAARRSITRSESARIGIGEPLVPPQVPREDRQIRPLHLLGEFAAITKPPVRKSFTPARSRILRY